jgi:ankyrin repeat protein
VTLAAHAHFAVRAQEDAAASLARAHAALDRDDENRNKHVAWRVRFDAWSRDVCVAAQTVEVVVDATLERLERTRSDACTQEEEAHICACVRACARALSRLDARAQAFDQDEARALLVSTSESTSALQDLLVRAAKQGDAALVELLLEDGRADPAAAVYYTGLPNDTCLSWAAFGGHTAVLALLLEDARVDPRAGVPALYGACVQNRVAVMELLLHHARVLIAPDEIARLFSVACEIGQADVVRLLLKDERVDPRSFCLFRACQKGKADVVRLLLEDGRADPAAADQLGPFACMRAACKQSNADVVRLLLEDGRTDPGYGSETDAANVLLIACQADQVDVARLLLQDRRVDPAYGRARLCPYSHSFSTAVIELLTDAG